jgi:hypothetical protein
MIFPPATTEQASVDRVMSREKKQQRGNYSGIPSAWLSQCITFKSS